MLMKDLIFFSISSFNAVIFAMISDFEIPSETADYPAFQGIHWPSINKCKTAAHCKIHAVNAAVNVSLHFLQNIFDSSVL